MPQPKLPAAAQKALDSIKSLGNLETLHYSAMSEQDVIHEVVCEMRDGRAAFVFGERGHPGRRLVVDADTYLAVLLHARARPQRRHELVIQERK